MKFWYLIILFTCFGCKNKSVELSNALTHSDSLDLIHNLQLKLYDEEIEYSNIDSNIRFRITSYLPNFIDTSFILSLNCYQTHYYINFKQFSPESLSFTDRFDLDIRTYYVKSRYIDEDELKMILNYLVMADLNKEKFRKYKQNNIFDGCSIEIYYSKGSEKINISRKYSELSSINNLINYLLKLLKCEADTISLNRCND